MNKNQEVVLRYLKAEKEFTNPLKCVKRLVIANLSAYNELTEKEQFEVLAEFAKWGLKRE